MVVNSKIVTQKFRGERSYWCKKRREGGGTIFSACVLVCVWPHASNVEYLSVMNSLVHER
jgi:hypothetical protein